MGCDPETAGERRRHIQRGYAHFGFASDTLAGEYPGSGVEPPKRVKTSAKRKTPPVLTAALVIGCLSVLLLSGGGFWLYQSRGGSNIASSATAASAARPTEYTVVIPAKTGATPAATVTTTTGKGSDRFNLNSVLSPVPLPWQTNGPLIVVSINAQKLTAYNNGKPAMTILVTTGMPALYTPQGTYHIIGRIANAMFYSPWPASSPYYYAPIHVNYGLKLTDSGIYLHDATWRSVFGPGTNVPHRDPVYGEESGSHGCVELPLKAMQWLYNWAPNGMAVAVVP